MEKACEGREIVNEVEMEAIESLNLRKLEVSYRKFTQKFARTGHVAPSISMSMFTEPIDWPMGLNDLPTNMPVLLVLTLATYIS